MDNLTHSLIGATIGELTFAAVARSERKRAPLAASVSAATHESSLVTPTLRYLLVWMGVIASNFPDIDVVYTRISPLPLGALLHHRGHTHTILGCVIGLFVCLGVVALWPKFRRLMAQDSRALQLTAAVGLLGLALHITADGLNSYGVHPFYPFSSQWFYGDLIFIIEPFWWIFLGVPLLVRAKPRWLWLPLLALMVAVMGYATSISYLSLGSAAALALALVAMLITVRRYGQLRGLRIGTALFFSYIVIQVVSEYRVRSMVTAKYTQPNVRLVDVALSPMPANPQCWSALVLMVDEPSQIYAVVKETAVSYSAIGEPESCPHARPPEVQGRLALADLRSLMQSDCWFAAWMQFARVPMVEGKTAVDLRFSGLGRTNFSSLPLVHPEACPRLIPGWGLPREDLLKEIKP